MEKLVDSSGEPASTVDDMPCYMSDIGIQYAHLYSRYTTFPL